jgi:hypothetical protein
MKQQFGDLELWLLSTGIHDTRRWIGFLPTHLLCMRNARRVPFFGMSRLLVFV